MVRKYFGTDGIRGKANEGAMTAETALRVGMAAGRVFRRGDHRHRVVIGKDTRLSGYMLEPALTAGFTCGRKIKCHPNYRTLQRSNSCKNPFKTMTYFNSAICKRFVGMEAGIIKVSS
ncbi:hypothetical protein K5E93_18035 [Acinetobacter baumannii]|nr:hypothetical protein [Acinetobacter baumannii]MCJ9259141.1 hypothetical protein [Acinetobacter baumannii]